MRVTRPSKAVIAALVWVALTPVAAVAADTNGSATRWADAWTGSAQGVYPVGYSVAQPGPTGPAGPGNTAPLLTAAFPDNQARNQTLRMIVHPSVAGTSWRVRLTNEFGTRPVTFGRAYVGLQSSGANVAPGSNRALTFGGRRSVTVPAGRTTLSDPVSVKVTDAWSQRLTVSLHIAGESGPMTWHAAAFTTSYVSDPNAGDHTADATDTAFPHSTTSWFFVSEVQAQRRDAATVVAFGDSITDGFFSTTSSGHTHRPRQARGVRSCFLRPSCASRTCALSSTSSFGSIQRSRSSRSRTAIGVVLRKFRMRHGGTK